MVRALHLEESRHKQCKFKIMMEKRELVALPSLSSLPLVIAVWLFLVVSWVCLQFVIVVFPDHTHFLFCKKCGDIVFYQFITGFLSCHMKNGVNRMKFVLVIPVYRVVVVSGKGNISYCFSREISK